MADPARQESTQNIARFAHDILLTACIDQPVVPGDCKQLWDPYPAALEECSACSSGIWSVVHARCKANIDRTVSKSLTCSLLLSQAVTSLRLSIGTPSRCTHSCRSAFSSLPAAPYSDDMHDPMCIQEYCNMILF